jgi:flavin-dependent dehydrogenase
MAKQPAQTDVLVLGNHPCAHLAATLLAEAGVVRVVHACIPDEPPMDRLVTVNPALFELHPLLASIKRKVKLLPIYGLHFLADDANTHSAQVGKSIGAYVTDLKPFRAATLKMMNAAKVESLDPSRIEILQLDERGLHIRLDDQLMHPKLMILAGELAPELKRAIGLPPNWDAEVVHRYTYLTVKNDKWLQPLPAKPLLPMSLDLGGTLNWAWLLPGEGQFQLAVEQPVRTVSPHPPLELLKRWITVLVTHGVLKAGTESAIDLSTVVSVDLPFAGALSQEGVANRTLLIGPAGGFYTACAEDLYPNCWSAIHAFEVAKKAIKEPHLQDALQPYRQRWGATLGDYLRGPQQNLRFLLPLVYRNATMTARLVDAILSGKSVVR